MPQVKTAPEMDSVDESGLGIVREGTASKRAKKEVIARSLAGCPPDEDQAAQAAGRASSRDAPQPLCCLLTYLLPDGIGRRFHGHVMAYLLLDEWDALNSVDEWDEDADEDSDDLAALTCVCTSLRDLANALWETRFKGRFLRSAALRTIDQRVAEDLSVKVNWRQAFRVVNDSVKCPRKWTSNNTPKCTMHDSLDIASCKQFGSMLAIVTREGNLSVFDCPTGTVTAALECKNTDLHIFAADAKHILVGQPAKIEYEYYGFGLKRTETQILGSTVLTLLDSVTLELVCEFDVQPDKSATRRLVKQVHMDSDAVLVFFSEDGSACFACWNRNTNSHLETLTAPELHSHESTDLISDMLLSTKGQFDPETGVMAPGGSYWESECFQDAHPGRRDTHKITQTKSYHYFSEFEITSKKYKFTMNSEDNRMEPECQGGGCAWDSTVLFPTTVCRYNEESSLTHAISVLHPTISDWDYGGGTEWQEGMLWSTSTPTSWVMSQPVTCEHARDVAWHDWMITATFGLAYDNESGSGFEDGIVCVRVWDLTEACSSQMLLSPVCSSPVKTAG
jgi:hypothetical protein